MGYAETLFFGVFYPGCIVRLPADENVVYLTFDDGPHPEITPFVLDELRRYQAKASFFLVGKNVIKYPGLVERILQDGHMIGNHSMNHEKGWKTAKDDYVSSVLRTGELIETSYFRPPYAKCTIAQFRALREKFRFVFYDVLAQDWKANLKGEDCFRLVMNKVRPGSVVVMHDSDKARDRIVVALPLILESLASKGYAFRALP
ncbi:MAG: polysaccharide deacetylase family protein [Bacteroidetes bacterium]|nr:polysaccharide deacetylase family protein [Bacteroidota bacterium]